MKPYKTERQRQVGVRYIGSKTRVAEAIVDLAGQPGDGRFVDAFCGTGAVAAVAAERGWPVLLNDAMPSAVALATGTLVGRSDVQFAALGGYERACELLDQLPGRAGFLYAQYSPASATTGEVERKYFTQENAARLDAMRAQIGAWAASDALTDLEEKLLLADLMLAANRVANISGTYGCFLNAWSSTALRAVRLQARTLPERATPIDFSVGDVFAVQTTPEDVVYYDPPYTKRQYAAYYHILETLTAGDEPEVGGITGLRPWRDKASDFCYKSRALEALTRLILGTTARKVLLSYSNEGHVPQEQLLAALTEAGTVTLHELETIGRYRPNAGAAAAGHAVHEFVVEVVPVGPGADLNDPDTAAATA